MVIQLNVLRGMGGGVQEVTMNTITIGMILIMSACLISEGFVHSTTIPSVYVHKPYTDGRRQYTLTLLSLKARIYALAKPRFGRILKLGEV